MCRVGMLPERVINNNHVRTSEQLYVGKYEAHELLQRENQKGENTLGSSTDKKSKMNPEHDPQDFTYKHKKFRNMLNFD